MVEECSNEDFTMTTRQLLVFTILWTAVLPVAADPIRGVHDDFDKANRFSRFNDVRLAIMHSAGIIVDSDLEGRYRSEHTMITRPLSCLVTVNKSGQITALSIDRSSGDKSVDERALKVIKNAAPFPASPSYEGTLKVQFSTEHDLVNVMSVKK
jgi:TonB family protein